MKTTPALALAPVLAVLLLVSGCAEERGATVDPQKGGKAAGAATFPEDFRGLGTEPFWAIHVSEGRLRYVTPENREGVQIDVEREAVEPGRMRLTGVLNDKALRLEGRIENCSDGMSDLAYPFTVTLKLGEEEWRGCARPVSASL